MKLKKLSTVLSLSFTGHRLHAAVLKRGSGGRPQVVRSTTASMALDPLNNDPQLVGRELRRLLDEANISEKNCVISLPLRWAFVLPIDLPEMAEEDRQGYLDIQLERGFPFAVEDLTMSTSWTEPRRATVVAIPLTYITALQAVLAAANLRAMSITLGITTLGDVNAKGASREGIDLVVGDESLEMAVRAGDGYAALRDLGDAIQRDPGATHFDGEMIVREMRLTMGRLSAEQMSNVRVVTVHGAPTLTQTLIEAVRPSLAKLSLTLDTGKLAEGKTGQEAAPQVIGAGARILRGQASLIELMPHVDSKWEGIRKRIASRGSLWLGGVAAVVIFSLVGLFGYQISELSRLNKEWAGMEEDNTRVAALQKKVKDFEPWFSKDPQSLQLLFAVTESFPRQDVWATTIKIEALNKVTMSGKARTTADYFRMTDGLANQKSIVEIGPPNLHTDPKGKDPMTYNLTFKWKGGK